MNWPQLKFGAAFRNIGRYLRERSAVDSRALAIFRICAGILIVADVIARSNRFTWFYTDNGPVPQELADWINPPQAFSLFALTSEPAINAGLFAAKFLIGVLLIIGYQTRIVTILAFVFVTSLDVRNPFILSYADTLFRMLLLWAMFLPLGERWSVDAVLRQAEPRKLITSLAAAVILVQMVYMYVGNGIMKFYGDLWRSGEATPLIFGLDHMTWGIAHFLRQWPAMLDIGGWLWFVMLVCGWTLIVAPGRLRMPIIAAFIIAHFSFWITVRIGAFPIVAIAGLTLFLREPFFADVERIYAWIGKRLPGLRSSAATVRATLITTAARFPDWHVPALPITHRIAVNLQRAVVGFLVVIIMLLPPPAFLERGGLFTLGIAAVEDRTGEIPRVFRVNQPPWTVFAPNPRTIDRYYVFPGRTENGEVYDVFADRKLEWSRAFDPLHHMYRHYRDRFYYESVEIHEPGEPTARYLAEHLCESWESPDGDRLTHINMWVVNEQITRETISDYENREVWAERIYRHGCGEHHAMEIDPPDLPREGPEGARTTYTPGD